MISVITPAYNAAKHITQTIESVQSQTYTDWEMLIVDDCSTDATAETVQSIAETDKRIRLIRHKTNSGAAAARNTALDAAKGDYIAFLDSDDLWMPQKLEKQHRFMETNGYVLTYTMYQLFDGNTNTRGKKISVPSVMTYESIFKNTSIACLTVMINKNKSGKFHMPLIGHTEDQCTWQEILKHGDKAYALKENLALYRVSAESLTGDKRKAAQKQWQTYRDYYKLSLLKSSYYFTCYVINAINKHFA